MASQQNIMKLAMGKIIANAWIDLDFKERLVSNPRSVLAEAGLQPPPHIEILVVENTIQEFYVPVPSPWMNTSDTGMMQRLQQNPRAVLADANIQVPEQAVITLLENTPNCTYIVLPIAPSYNECSIEKL